jgi:hypothetical protein
MFGGKPNYLRKMWMFLRELPYAACSSKPVFPPQRSLR